MSKHISLQQWLDFYDLYIKKDYETLSHHLLIKTGRDWNKPCIQHRLKDKFHKYRKSNFDKNIFINKTGWAKKKGTNSGRPLKKKNKHMELLDFYNIGYTNLTHKQKRRIIEIVEWCKKYDKYEPIIKMIKHHKVSYRKLAQLLMISKSTLNRWVLYGQNNKKWQNKCAERITQIYYDFNGNIGRKVIAHILKTNHNIDLSDRQVGNIMKKLNLKCRVRVFKQSPRIKEQKDTKINIPDYVQRDYNNTRHDQIILANDCTYLPPTKDCKSRHLYFVGTIEHNSKCLVSWALSDKNDIALALQSIQNIKQGNYIFHSDHGSVYSSNIFRKEIQKRNWIQSMSRVGNCLDNREIEHFFGTFKCELIYQIDVSKLTFLELKNIIEKWIKNYNEKRIQKNLGWKTPMQIHNSYNI